MHNNEALRDRENLKKMVEIMMTFDEKSRQNLLDDPSRKFIFDGPLNRQCRRAVKEFHYWLFTDKLLYGEPTGLGYYRVHREIPLVELRIAPAMDNIVNANR